MPILFDFMEFHGGNFTYSTVFFLIFSLGKCTNLQVNTSAITGEMDLCQFLHVQCMCSTIRTAKNSLSYLIA